MAKRKKQKQSPKNSQAAKQPVQQPIADEVEDEIESAEEMADDEADEVEEVVAAVKPQGATPLTPPVRRVRAVRRDMSGRPGGAGRGSSGRSSSPKKDPKSDTAYIRSRLANPTRIVTTEELRKEYGYVMSDLRTMGVLAGALVVLLFVLERIL
ncbi:MAG: hypothetical protein R3E39_17840 [Anaerolineae bacterium]